MDAFDVSEAKILSSATVSRVTRPVSESKVLKQSSWNKASIDEMIPSTATSTAKK